MSYKLVIEKADNGYALFDGEENKLLAVIEDDYKDELKSAEELLWEVLNYFGVFGSKHDPERIRIVREKNK